MPLLQHPLLDLAEHSNRILDQISEMVIITDASLNDPDGPRILYVNSALFELTGYNVAELIDKTPRILQGEATDKNTSHRIRKALTAGDPVQETILNYKKNGATYWAELNIVPLRDMSGNITHFLSVQRDVTKERHFFEQLDETKARAELNEHHFASARRIAKIGVFDYSVNEDLQFWSDELIEMTGLGADIFPAPGDAFISGIDKDDRPAFDQLFERAIEHGEDYSITVRFSRPDGCMMYMQIMAEVRDIEGIRHIIGIARDCTEEMEAANLLRQEEERFRIIADTVSDVLWDYHINDAKFWVSPNWAAKLRLDLGTDNFNPELWTDYLAEDCRAAAKHSLRAALKSDQALWRHETKIRTSDGSHVDIEINATLQRRSDGSVFRILGNVRNVTIERRQRDGFSRSRALEAVGKMTGGIAHDFNNLLMVIQGSAELLEPSDLSEEDRNSIDLIIGATRSAADLTARLLSFSGHGRLKTTQIDLKTTLNGLQPLLQSALTSAIELKVKIPDDVWNIQADVGAFEQTVINLAVNARDAMPQGGRLDIKCESHRVSKNASGATHNPDLDYGDYVCISFIDTGMGMSEKVLAQAFEPFFTTKEVGKGTGLGLSSVYGFAKQSGGNLEISSLPGKGCTVRLYLPACMNIQTNNKPAANKLISPKRFGVKVLVVEDQSALRTLVDRVLRRSGFDVTVAPDGNAALALLKAKNDFEILFTDVIMPGGMSGVQLAEAALKINPPIKVLFTTGYTADAFKGLPTDKEKEVRVLKKPYKTEDLIQALNEII